jgi:hypothetical protein
MKTTNPPAVAWPPGGASSTTSTASQGRATTDFGALLDQHQARTATAEGPKNRDAEKDLGARRGQRRDDATRSRRSDDRTERPQRPERAERPERPERPAPRRDDDDDDIALLPHDEGAGFQYRWQELQTGFVDEPRRTVEQADELVAQVMQRLAESFASERERLEGQWGRGEDVSTEDLRVALQRYRAFFRRLLSA